MAPIISIVPPEERQDLTESLLLNEVAQEHFKAVKVKRFDLEIRVVLLVTAIVLILLSCVMLSNVYASHKRAQRWQRVVETLQTARILHRRRTEEMQSSEEDSQESGEQEMEEDNENNQPQPPGSAQV